MKIANPDPARHLTVAVLLLMLPWSCGHSDRGARDSGANTTSAPPTSAPTNDLPATERQKFWGQRLKREVETSNPNISLVDKLSTFAPGPYSW